MPGSMVNRSQSARSTAQIKFTPISSDKALVQDERHRAHSVELSTLEMMRTNSLSTPKPGSQLLLSPDQTEIARWKPSDPKTLEVLQSHSAVAKQQSWNHAELADLVVNLAKGNDWYQHKEALAELSEQERYWASVDEEAEQGPAHLRSALEVANIRIKELEESAYYLTQDSEYWQEEHGFMEAENEELQGDKEALQDEVYELQAELERLQGSKAAESKQEESVQDILLRGENAAEAKMAKEREEMKTKLEQERVSIKARSEKGQVELKSKLEAEKSQMKARLEAERDGAKVKLSSLKRKLALMLAGENEGEASRVKYSSMKRNVLLILAE